MLVSVIEGNATIGPFGVDLKQGAAEQLGDSGQIAKDANAIPALKKLSTSPKASKEAKAAALAALEKLNAAQ